MTSFEDGQLMDVGGNGGKVALAIVPDIIRSIALGLIKFARLCRQSYCMLICHTSCWEIVLEQKKIEKWICPSIFLP